MNIPAAPEPLPGTCIDAHTHVDSVAEFSGLAPDDNLAMAAAVGIDRLVQIGCDLEGSRWAEEFARTHPQVIAAVAIHPNDAARMDDAELDAAIAVIDELAGSGEHVRAVGETGMDTFRTKGDEAIARQAESFRRHIAIAKRHDMTLAIHDRDAHDQVLDILDEEGWPERVIFHCFSADETFARTALDHGAWLSFAGNITYNANHAMRGGLDVAGDESILVETDAPYLTPVPHRGKPNASYLICHTIAFIAERRGWSLEQTCRQLSANAEAAYGGSWGRG